MKVLFVLGLLGPAYSREQEERSDNRPTWTEFIKSCNDPQGLSNSALPDRAFSASSSHYSTLTFSTWHPHNGRLYYAPAFDVTNAWMPEFDEPDNSHYLQVDLGSIKGVL